MSRTTDNEGLTLGYRFMWRLSTPACTCSARRSSATSATRSAASSASAPPRSRPPGPPGSLPRTAPGVDAGAWFAFPESSAAQDAVRAAVLSTGEGMPSALHRFRSV